MPLGLAPTRHCRAAQSGGGGVTFQPCFGWVEKEAGCSQARNWLLLLLHDLCRFHLVSNVGVGC
uniref:Uncharacterized protein n=1 Tax=Physcomitrium patens TaxID=3218 RepID=A0A2K1KG97_PHYPA|nr:hypothetical protein PHYPA_009182 [Physcomitrium patens]